MFKKFYDLLEERLSKYGKLGKSINDFYLLYLISDFDEIHGMRKIRYVNS